MNIKKIDIQKLKKSEIAILVEIAASELDMFRAEAIKKVGKNVDIPGFRKDHIPEGVLVKKVGDMPILEEMAGLAINKAYPQILSDNDVRAIGSPEITITKIAKGEDLHFKIKVATIPEVSIGDYKAIAKKSMKGEKEKVAVDDKEIDKVIEQILKYRNANSSSFGADEHNDGGNTKDGDKNKTENSSDVSENNFIPNNPQEITDDFVRTLGNFDNVADFRDSIRENIKTENEAKIKQKKRMSIMEQIIKESSFEIPDIVVENEIDKMMAQFQGDISRMGLKFDEYMKHIKKDKDDLRKEWRSDAEKNAAVQILLNHIAVKENIKPDEKKVEQEVGHILETYKDASSERARAYVETILMNEAVFEFLENVQD